MTSSRRRRVIGTVGRGRVYTGHVNKGRGQVIMGFGQGEMGQRWVMVGRGGRIRRA